MLVRMEENIFCKDKDNLQKHRALLSLFVITLVIFLDKYLKIKSGNRKKTKLTRGVMEGTEGERSSWINKEKTQATGFPWLVIWYNVESQIQEYS